MPHTHQNTAAILGCVLALNRTSIKCYIHLEGANSNKVLLTDSKKPCAKVWGRRFRTKFISHVRKIAFWLTPGATASHMSHHIQNGVQMPQTFLPLGTFKKKKKALVEFWPFLKEQRMWLKCRGGMHACHPGTWDGKAVESRVPGQPWLHSQILSKKKKKKKYGRISICFPYTLVGSPLKYYLKPCR